MEMAEYIEREAVCYQLAKQATIDGQPRAIRRAAKIVADFPSADVVPVVRCKECAYHDTADYGDGYTKNVCSLWNRQIQDDDYCSYGLKKGGDEE